MACPAVFLNEWRWFLRVLRLTKTKPRAMLMMWSCQCQKPPFNLVAALVTEVRCQLVPWHARVPTNSNVADAACVWMWQIWLQRAWQDILSTYLPSGMMSAASLKTGGVDWQRNPMGQKWMSGLVWAVERMITKHSRMISIYHECQEEIVFQRSLIQVWDWHVNMWICFKCQHW